MPISVQTPLVEHVPNGVTTVFPYPFCILSSDDLNVVKDGVTLTSGFTISGIGDRDGGAITFSAAPTGSSLLIYREVSLDRETDYQQNGDLREEVLDADFDRVWMALQEQGAALGRTLRAPLGETLEELPSASSRASKYVGFDSLGQRVLLDAPSASDASALIISLASAVATKGADMVAWIRAATGAVSYTLGTWLGWQKPNWLEFMTTAERIDVIGRTGALDVTTAVQAAITASAAAHRVLECPGIARITDTLLIPNKTQLKGEHQSMGFEGGTKIIFAPTTVKSLFVPTGSPASGKDGYLIDGFYIVGNSASAAGNSDIALDIVDTIKSNFKNLRIQGFRTAVSCTGTNSNVFERMHLTDNFVQNVLYTDGTDGPATTDMWLGGYISNAPRLVRTTGDTSAIKWVGTTFESAGEKSALGTDQTIAFDFVQETEGWEFIGCYGEDLNNTDNVTNVTFNVGFGGTAPPGALQVSILGGKWGGRNAGGKGAFVKTGTIDCVYVGGGAQIARYDTAIDNSDAATLTNQVATGSFFCASVSTIISNPEKVTGSYPAGALSNPATRGMQISTMVGDQFAGTPTACTGAITASGQWKLTKDGIVVTLTLLPVTGTAAAQPSFTFGEVLPALYRPSTSHEFGGVTIINNGAAVAQPGVVEIDYLTGAITVYRDATKGTNFTAAANAGIGASFAVSWAV